jgi:hypothetical protein
MKTYADNVSLDLGDYGVEVELIFNLKGGEIEFLMEKVVFFDSDLKNINLSSIPLEERKQVLSTFNKAVDAYIDRYEDRIYQALM